MAGAAPPFSLPPRGGGSGWGGRHRNPRPSERLLRNSGPTAVGRPLLTEDEADTECDDQQGGLGMREADLGVDPPTSRPGDRCIRWRRHLWEGDPYVHPSADARIQLIWAGAEGGQAPAGRAGTR